MKTENPAYNTRLFKALCFILDHTQGFSRKFVFHWNEIKYTAEFKKFKKKRTLPQNRLYRLWLKVISEETGDDQDSLHRSYKEMFLPLEEIKTRVGTFLIRRSTTKLDTREFTEYLENIRHHALSFLNIKKLPNPGDQYWDEFIEQYG
jgi:hypothetical protein